MRRSLILMVSAGLNVVLAVVLFFPAHRVAPGTPGTAAELPAGDASNRVRTQVVVRRQYFTWNEVESSDYRIYIARLRDIGCPERTIRDIVVADVNELYARKRMSEVVTPDQQWWRSDPDTNVMAAANARLQALDQERRALLTSLLGPDWEAEDLSRSLIPLNGPVLGNLSPEVKQSVQNIVARAQQRLQAYLNAQQSQGRQPDPVELTRLGQQMRSELATVLNPAQLEEFLLRYSPTANELREQLRGFTVSPDDFRRLFRLRDPISQQIHLLNPDDPVNAPRLAALQKQLDDTLKTVLSPEQYQAYVLAQDPAWRDAVTLGQQSGASSNAVQKIYKVNQASSQEADRIRNDPTLTPEQKAAQLKAVDDAQKSALDQVLGVTPAANTNAPPDLPPTPPPPPQLHSFSPGETVDIIADRYGVSTDAILKANPDVDFNHLARGTAIKIPTRQ